MSAAKPLRIVVAGGGTGGHLYPGIAVAQEFLRMEPGAEILFVGSRRPFEKKAVEAAGFQHKALAVEGLKGRGLALKIKALFMLGWSILKALGILLRFRPRLILGVGGYASAPCVIGGFMLGMKTAIQEQNLAPGLANRLLGKLAGRAYASFPQTLEYFDERKVRVFGNPVRKSLLNECAEASKTQKDADGPFTVLVLGGSQGAHGINEAVCNALPQLRTPGRFAFIHQTGEQDLVEVERAYKFWGGGADVRPFFHDMGRVYSLAGLVICRAGASTVAELTALGKPAVFVPFPFAADNHQEVNARALEEAGAAEVILEQSLSGTLLAERILFYEERREQLEAMGSKARGMGKPGAASDIAEDALAWVG